MAAGRDEDEGGERKAWERMAGESIAWYGRFKLFLSLGHDAIGAAGVLETPAYANAHLGDLAQLA